MSNGEGYRSPKSNVPNAPIRFAGIAPTTVTKGQMTDQVVSGLIEQGRTMLGQSMDLQTQLNLNQLESEVYADLQMASTDALSKNSIGEVEETFDAAIETARGRIGTISSGSNRQALDSSLNEREGILRANHITPRLISIKRDQRAAQEQLFRQINMDTAAAGDRVLTDNAITGMTARIASLVQHNGMTHEQAITQGMKEANGLVSTTVNTMLNGRRFSEALDYVNDMSTPLTREVRDSLWDDVIKARSSANYLKIMKMFTAPEEQNSFNEWLAPGHQGQKVLDEMLANDELIESHYSALTKLRAKALSPGSASGRSGRSGLSKKEQDINTSIIQAIESRNLAAGEGKNAPNLSDFVSKNDPYRTEVIEAVYSLDQLAHKQVRADQGLAPENDLDFAMRWAYKTGQVPTRAVQGLYDNMHITENMDGKDKDQLIRSMEVLSNIQSAASFGFSRMELTKTQKQHADFYELYKSHWLGQSTLEAKKEIDFAKASGISQTDAGSALQIMLPKDALNIALQTTETLNGSSAHEFIHKRRTRFQEQINEMDGTYSIGVNSAVEAYNDAVGGGDFTAEEIGSFRLNAIQQVAKERYAQKGLATPKAAFRSAADELYYQRGHEGSKYNSRDGKEIIEIHPIDSSKFDGAIGVELVDTEGTSIPIGREAHRADINLDFGRRVAVSLVNSSDPIIKNRGLELMEVINVLMADTTYTTGHARRFDGRVNVGWEALDLNNIAPGTNVQRMPGSNTLERLMQTWADTEGDFSLDQAYALAGLIAFNGNTMPEGTRFELETTGDPTTMDGVTADGVAAPSWAITAVNQHGPQQITWSGAFPRGWRRDFEQEMLPEQEVDRLPTLTNPVLIERMHRIHGLTLGELNSKMEKEIEITRISRQYIDPLRPTFEVLRSVSGGMAALSPTGKLAEDTNLLQHGINLYEGSVRRIVRNLYTDEE